MREMKAMAGPSSLLPLTHHLDRTVVIEAPRAIVFRFFPKKDEETQLRANYHAQDAVGEPGAVPPPAQVPPPEPA